jgi:hypothetical protein
VPGWQAVQMLIFNVRIKHEELNFRFFQASPEMSDLMPACFWRPLKGHVFLIFRWRNYAAF